MSIQHKIHTAALAVCSAAALALAGCGGGGGDDTAPAPPTPADSAPVNPPSGAPINLPIETTAAPDTPDTPETPGTPDAPATPKTPDATPSAVVAPWGMEGAWSTLMGWSVPTGYASQMIILDNGSLWGTYGINSFPFYKIGGLLHGTAKAGDDNSVSASFMQFDVTDPALNTQNSFSGSLTRSSFLSLTLGDGTATQLIYDNRYDQAATLDETAPNIQGKHTGTVGISGSAAFGQQVFVGITISGSTLTASGHDTFFSGPINSCTINGTLVPHTTPHGTVGVFDTRITFSGPYCALGHETTFNGIIRSAGSNGKKLEIMAVTPDGQTGFLFIE